MAAPVFRDGRAAIAWILVSGPSTRLGPARLSEVTDGAVQQKRARYRCFSAIDPEKGPS